MSRVHYFKRYWNESRGDTNNAWGCSMWYFETDASGFVTRQVEVYDQGPTLKYHEGHLDDRFGGLSYQSLNLDEFAQFEILKVEFDLCWNKSSDGDR